MKSIKNKVNLKWFIIILLILPMFGVGQTRSIQLNRSNTIPVINVPTPDQGLSRETNEAEWIHYDDTEMDDGWGFLISGEEYDVVSKWDPEDITDYAGYKITKIKFIVTNENPYLKVKVWEGEDFTEIYSQDVPEFNVNTWTEVTLDTPVTIDVTEELYVGYYVDMLHMELGGFVTATDAGPPVDEYGNLFKWNGDWYSEYNNHNLQVYIELALASEFEADETDVCEGGTVNFTDLSDGAESWSWTFEGGTPSTSTEQNPSVVYETPGTYDVSLEVSIGDESDTETKTDYINVYELPGQADQPNGETGVCTGQIYTYEIEEVPYAQEYEWVLTPAEAGYLYWQENVATLETDEDWTGDFTIKVRATNVCGEGELSEELECISVASPSLFNVEGGGSYCLGDDGVEVTLSSSQVDIDYELYLDSETTGNVVAGTGDEISFGLQTEEGYYSVIGSSENCDQPMSDEVYVQVLFPPLEPGTPEGPEVVCADETSDYEATGTDDADSYDWILDPEDAGTLSTNGLEVTVDWNDEFSGTATLTIYGINECGEGNPAAGLDVEVNALPSPTIEGDELVCNDHAGEYMVEENDGSTYTWIVTGGTITEGEGTYSIVVLWGDAGTGTVSVEELSVAECLGASEIFEVTIDDCTAIDENNPETSLSVYPNPVENGFIHIVSGNSTDLDIQIINSSGIVVIETKENNSSTQINISELSKGLYFVKTSGNNKNELVKFIKR